MFNKNYKELVDEIKSLKLEIESLKAQQSAGQNVYSASVVPADYSHQHMPSALKSGNLAAAINFTTRPTYNGADVIVDGDPVGLQADDDSTRLGVDADTAVTTGTKVLHTQLVGPTGITPAIRAANSDADPDLDGLDLLGIHALLSARNDVNTTVGIGAKSVNIAGSTLNGLVSISPLFAYHVTNARFDAIDSNIVHTDGNPNIDGYNALATFALLMARKDEATTLGVTLTDGTYNPLHVQLTDGEEKVITGKYAVTMEIENIAASQDFILIDKSDTTNFPHASATGIVHITILDVEVDPDSSFVGDIELGFLENVDGDNGDYHVIKEWHMEKRADLIEDFVNLIGDPFKCSSTYHLTNAISLNDEAFQDDVALSSPYDDAAAYTTVSGDGDIALRITMSAGSADLSIEIKYYVA